MSPPKDAEHLRCMMVMCAEHTRHGQKSHNLRTPQQQLPTQRQDRSVATVNVTMTMAHVCVSTAHAGGSSAQVSLTVTGPTQGNGSAQFIGTSVHIKAVATWLAKDVMPVMPTQPPHPQPTTMSRITAVHLISHHHHQAGPAHQSGQKQVWFWRAPYKAPVVDRSLQTSTRTHQPTQAPPRPSAHAPTPIHASTIHRTY